LLKERNYFQALWASKESGGQEAEGQWTDSKMRKLFKEKNNIEILEPKPPVTPYILLSQPFVFLNPSSSTLSFLGSCSGGCGNSSVIISKKTGEKGMRKDPESIRANNFARARYLSSDIWAREAVKETRFKNSVVGDRPGSVSEFEPKDEWLWKIERSK
jgi:hypothetical protein